MFELVLVVATKPCRHLTLNTWLIQSWLVHPHEPLLLGQVTVAVRLTS